MPTPRRDAERLLRVAPIPGKGRGLVAGCRIACGRVVDVVPVIVVPARSATTVQETVLGRFTFAWDERTGSVALALGRVSLLNHSYTPNLAAEKRVGTRMIAFIALRDVDQGEELTINYHGQADCQDPVGFPVVGT